MMNRLLHAQRGVLDFVKDRSILIILTSYSPTKPAHNFCFLAESMNITFSIFLVEFEKNKGFGV